MTRGGKRKGAGRPTKWREGTTKEDTKTVRIPKRIVDDVLEYAYKLDNNCVAQSKSISIEDLELLKSEALKSLCMGVQSNPYKRLRGALNKRIEYLKVKYFL